MKSFFEIFFVFLKLGLISFGGPVAHLGFFRDELIERRKWITEAQYADVIALCQFLPGPASSQVGLTLGLFRGGWAGGAAAWLGFTLPSAVFLAFFGYGVRSYEGDLYAGGLIGLKVAAVAIVANALWGMAVKLCPDLVRRLLALLSAGFLVLVSGVVAQLVVIVMGGIVGMIWLRSPTNSGEAQQGFPWKPSWKVSVGCLGVFAGLLVGLPIVSQITDVFIIDLLDSFYRAGALVFGGGHVVLPLLEAEVVHSGWINEESFLAGYGITQAVPGPLFTFASFLGASVQQEFLECSPWVGAVLCLVAIFLSTWLLVPGVLPLWDKLRCLPKAQGALAGINAVVVGLLLAAFYHPVWTQGIHGKGSFFMALGSFLLLAILKIPAWAVVLLAAVGGACFF